MNVDFYGFKINAVIYLLALGIAVFIVVLIKGKPFTTAVKGTVLVILGTSLLIIVLHIIENLFR